MRIYDPSMKQVLRKVTLFVTPEEAAELGQSALELASHPENHHHHVPDAEYQREITVAVYTPATLAEFDAESQNIINAA
jgi:hypothetical protein